VSACAERQRKGLTVREMARRIGVSPSLISQIERDKVNPPVSTLWGLVTVLELPMSDLFQEDGGPTGPSPVAPVPAAAGPLTTPGNRAVINLETGVRWERLTAASDPVVEFVFGIVRSGKLGVRIGFDEYELTPGMAVSFDSSSPHRLWAIGDEPAEAIWVVVGRQSDNRGPVM
jgi:transcriptional regulator with XRE-family HTH domain